MKKILGVSVAALLIVVTLIACSGKEEEVLIEPKEGSTSVFSIYTVDSESMSLKKETELRVSRKSHDIKEALEGILMTISEDKFDGLEIKVDSIIKEESRDIAIIELIDVGNKKSNWEEDYFKDVIEGGKTETILIENILQRDIEEDWIDGVRFIYKGKEMNNKNVPLLCQTNYR